MGLVERLVRGAGYFVGETLQPNGQFSNQRLTAGGWAQVAVSVSGVECAEPITARRRFLPMASSSSVADVRPAANSSLRYEMEFIYG